MHRLAGGAEERRQRRDRGALPTSKERYGHTTDLKEVRGRVTDRSGSDFILDLSHSTLMELVINSEYRTVDTTHSGQAHFGFYRRLHLLKNDRHVICRASPVLVESIHDSSLRLTTGTQGCSGSDGDNCNINDIIMRQGYRSGLEEDER